uniref:BED-type domain-containing protein n=1 Tax=Panagrolaimus superbus TaxID=310955 RepID=A0A914YD33_9BILA
MQRTKRTMLEEDICLIELAGSSEDLESLSDENVITEFQNAEITVVTESEPVIHVISDPPTTSSRASNISNTATKNVEKLTPAYINSLKKRDLKLDEFEFGVDGRNKEECRILVSDENDKNAFRMYAKYQGKWYCRQCDKKTSRKIWGILKNGIFSAPPKHLCLPITRKKWENEQKYIKERFSNSSLLSSHSNISLTKDSEQQTRKSTSSVACNETVSSISNDFTTSRPSTSLSSSSTNMHTNEFREVDTCDAEYGFNEYGKIKGRLIVREPGNRKFVREYTVTEATKNWRCLNCKIGIAKKNENGNFFVSTNHDCAAISYATIQENQNLFEAKYKQLTNSPSKKYY